MINEPNDNLDDLLGGPMVNPSEPRMRVTPPASYQPKDFTERCRKCSGTGRFSNLGVCFACNGKGSKTFKTSAAQRASNREKAADRKARNLAADVEAFKAEFPHIWSWMDGSTFSFAVSLREGLLKYGSLTDRQIAAAEGAIAKYEAAVARKQEERAQRPGPVAVDVSKLENAFATARERANRPNQRGVFVKAIALHADNGLDVKFQPGSEGSQWQGMIFAKSAEGKKLGYVKDGRFTRRFECTDAEAAAVLDCASDPEKAAVAYGKAWSCCGICGRTLLNDESIARGIGPICAERFGW